jgi:alkylation response protein AidB-like acyl-CoA dehydrogenase
MSVGSYKIIRLRDPKLSKIGKGTSEIQKLIIARGLLRDK